MKESYEHYSKALAIAQKSNLKGKKAECQKAIEIYDLYMKGKDYRSSGKHQESIASFKKAIDLAQKLKSKEHELKCLRQMSVTCWEQNNYQEFFYLNKKAMKIAEDLRHLKEKGVCLNNIGLFYWKIDNYAESLKYYENALEIAKKIKNIQNESEILNNMALIYIEIGNCDNALLYLSKALKIDRQFFGDNYVSIDLNNIGRIFRRKGLLSNDRGDFYQALRYFNDSLRLAEKIKETKTEIYSINNMGIVYSDLENYSEALKYFQLGLDLAHKSKDTFLSSMILNNTGIVYLKSGSYEESIKYFKGSIDLALKIKNDQILWEAYFGLGQCQEKKENFSSAIDYYEKSIESIERIRSQLFLDIHKTGFLRNKLEVYESLIYLLYRLRGDKPDQEIGKEIFYFIERSKARAFLESLAESKVNIRENLNPGLRKKDKEISRRISLLLSELLKINISKERRKELEEKLAQEEDHYMRFISQMRVENPEAASLVLPQPCRLEQVQNNLLNEKTALIEYFLGKNQSFMFFITKDGFSLYGLPPRQEIEDSLKAYLKVLSCPPRGKFLGALAAKRICRELLFPLEKIIDRSIDTLIIIPDGVLYYLPFETLARQDSDQSLHYLIQDYRISYAPSSSSLLILLEKKLHPMNSKDLLAFGDPIYKRECSQTGIRKLKGDIVKEMYDSQGIEFPSLPYSRNEISGISKYFSKDKRDIYLGNLANEGMMKRLPLKDYKVVHFACHGFLDEKFPFRSALILSLNGNDEEDGFLQVREIYNLRLNASLVILSACQTGLGSLESGEGVLGLPRIFFYTGAKSVLSTLWVVGDRSTAVFIKKFYRHLLKGNGKAQALRLAKLDMVKSKFFHPFYWAAYILNGESRENINF